MMKDGNHGSQVDSSRLCFPPTRRFKSKTVRKSNKKQGIKNFTFSYHIQKKCGDIANKIPNAADDDERTFTYRWPNSYGSYNDNTSNKIFNNKKK